MTMPINVSYHRRVLKPQRAGFRLVDWFVAGLLVALIAGTLYSEFLLHFIAK
jgi:hypothetical protein